MAPKLNQSFTVWIQLTLVLYVALGSAILHELSLSMELDFFIMFSSISGILGNSGQVAYAAANSFLDQLCEYRRHKLGLPALSVNWGPISGAGVLERNTDITSILETTGFYTLHYTTGRLICFAICFVANIPGNSGVTKTKEQSITT